MQLYIVRHGQPIYGEHERLTDIGKKQARAVIKRLEHCGITEIYSSPLRRTRETAEPTANALGLPIHIVNWMSEDLAFSRFSVICDDGLPRWVWDWENTTELVKGANHDAGDEWWNIEPLKKMTTAKEGYAALMAESDDFLARLGYVREGNVYREAWQNFGRIAVFCHHGFGVTWLSHLLRIPPNVFWLAFDITHTGLTIVDFPMRPGNHGYCVPRVKCLSDMSHLFADEYTEMKYNTHEPM